MDRAEAVKILEIQLDVTEVNTPSCIELHEALELAIETLKEPTGDYEFFGGTYAKEGDAESATTTVKLKNRCDSLLTADSDECKEQKSKLDCISRQAAIEAFCDDCRGLKPGQCEHWDSCKSQKELRSLPPVTPKEQTDCTDFINWLLEEVMDEENWELNAVANGEIICRKLKKLDLLEVKDGYYVRASVTPTERTGEWIPVSERLAEFPCIVTDANGNPPFVPLGIATITDKEHGTWQIDGDKANNPKVIIDGEEGTIANWGNRIIAWMPLPEPYKGGDTE